MNENDSGAKRQKMLQDLPAEVATASEAKAAEPLEIEDGDSEDGFVSWYYNIVICILLYIVYNI